MVIQELNEAEKNALVLCLLETALHRGKTTWPIILSIAEKTGVINEFKQLGKEMYIDFVLPTIN